MPCRLNGDVHEWLNEVVTVPNQDLPNSFTSEKTSIIQWEAKTLQTFTATCCCDSIMSAQSKQEHRTLALAKGEQKCNTTHPLQNHLLIQDSIRPVFWLGRHPAEKISVGPKDKLIQIGNLEQSVKAKACLTVFRKARNAGVKAGLSELTMTFNGSSK